MSRRAIRDESAQRCEEIRSHLKKRSQRALIVSNPVHVRYLSGYMGDDAYLFIGLKKQYIITDSRYTEQAESEAPDFEVVKRTESLQAVSGRLARKHRCAGVLCEVSSLMQTEYKALRKELQGIKLKAAKGLVSKMRLIKTEREIELIRRCIEIAQRAFRATRRRIRPGMSERMIAARLGFEMRRLGADRDAFPSIVAVGARGSLPHARCTDRPARRGSTVLVDWGARRDLYNCDLTRTLLPPKIPSRLKRIYEIVLEAQRRSIEAAAPGVECSHVDAAAREYIRTKGYGKRFEHGTGHGVGMEVHEGPRIAAESKDVLEPGMVFTVEPGIYIPGRPAGAGWGGVRIEDMVLITESGHEVLTSEPKALDRMRCSRL